MNKSYKEAINHLTLGSHPTPKSLSKISDFVKLVNLDLEPSAWSHWYIYYSTISLLFS